VLFAPPLHAQQLPVGDILEDYLRVVQLAGQAVPTSFTVRPMLPRGFVDQLSTDSSHPWAGRIRAPRVTPGRITAGFTDLRVRLFENTAIPWGMNDGAVWQGRGVTLALSGGAFARAGPLTLELKPAVLWNQNRAFALAAVNKTGRQIYGNPWHPLSNNQNVSIDLPQRFGPDAFTTLDWSGSSLRFESRGVSLGFATRHAWWGPGMRNAIVMSDNAPGFPHAFLATQRPVSVGIGTIEGQWIWGRLQQSDYFDSTVTNTRRFITGAALAFSPHALEGLTLGMSRVFYEYVPAGGLGARDYLLIFNGLLKEQLATPGNPTGNDARDQLLSLFARWRVPGFESYVEWARNDHNASSLDYLTEPEHSQAYTLGLMRVQSAGRGRWLRVLAELTHLERSKTYILRGTPVYYTHHIVQQGYTQRGQVIGSGLGPGGDGQFLGVDLFQPWGRMGMFFARQVYDNDAAFALFESGQITTRSHDVGYTFGATALALRGGLTWSGTLALTREIDRYYVLHNDVTNLHVELGVSWQP
jgi:hypothetical protein